MVRQPPTWCIQRPWAPQSRMRRSRYLFHRHHKCPPDCLLLWIQQSSFAETNLLKMAHDSLKQNTKTLITYRICSCQLSPAVHHLICHILWHMTIRISANWLQGQFFAFQGSNLMQGAILKWCLQYFWDIWPPHPLPAFCSWCVYTIKLRQPSLLCLLYGDTLVVQT